MRKKRMVLAVLLFAMVFSCLSPAGQTRAAQKLDYGGFCITEGQSYSFKNAASGWYMNVKHAGKTNGTEINVWPLDMSAPVSERYVFTVVDAANYVVRISPEPTKSQYLDVRLRNGSFGEGKTMCLWAEDKTNNKNLRLDLQPDGSFYITFVEHPGYCIGAKSAEAAGTAQTALVVCKMNGAAEQRWILCDKDGNELVKANAKTTKLSYDSGNDDIHTIMAWYESVGWEGFVFWPLYDENHTFENGKCKECGALQAYKTNGDYVTKQRVWVYKKDGTCFTDVVKQLNADVTVKIANVEKDENKNYWGLLEDGSGYVRMTCEMLEQCSVFDTTIQARILELFGKMGGKLNADNTGSGKSFTTTLTYSREHGSSGNSCTAAPQCKECRLENVIQSAWFKERFGTVSAKQLPLQNKWSCYAFSSFAQWYLFKEKDTDYIKDTELEPFVFTKSTFWDDKTNAPKMDEKTGKPVVRAGDHVRVWSYHSVIIYSYDETGVTVLDCNSDYHCTVKMRKILYSDKRYNGKTFTIYRAYRVE